MLSPDGLAKWWTHRLLPSTEFDRFNQRSLVVIRQSVLTVRWYVTFAWNSIYWDWIQWATLERKGSTAHFCFAFVRWQRSTKCLILTSQSVQASRVWSPRFPVKVQFGFGKDLHNRDLPCAPKLPNSGKYSKLINALINNLILVYWGQFDLIWVKVSATI